MDEPSKGDLTTPAGRDKLYATWRANLIEHGLIDPNRVPTKEEQRELFARWMRDLVKRGILDPQGLLPAQTFLAEPFGLHVDQVGRVMRRLRNEKLLPPKKLRLDAGISEWTPRDLYCWEWIADQRAIRYDQLRRILARESVASEELKDEALLSMSRTTQTIKRWAKSKLVRYEPVLARQPGWIWLTKKGLEEAGSEYTSAEAPAPGSVTHLYLINEVRLWLEDSHQENECFWTSERWLQHQRDTLKKKGEKLPHMEDAWVEIDDERGKRHFEVEVERSRKSGKYLDQLMRGGGPEFTNDNLIYFVTSETETTVMQAFQRLSPYTCQRGWVEVFLLPGFKRLGHFESGSRQ